MATTAKYKTDHLYMIKFVLLLLWSLWFCLASLTNITDLLIAAHILPDTWPFRSGNYAQIVEVISIYSLSPAFATLLFVIDIVVQCTITVLFGIATRKWWQKRTAWKWINAALLLSIALWASFLLVDEFFIAYRYEATHSTLLICNLLTLFALQLLADN